MKYKEITKKNFFVNQKIKKKIEKYLKFIIKPFYLLFIFFH